MIPEEKETAQNKFFAPPTRGEEEDMFGQVLLTDGDRMGEIIPSLFAWMPPEAMRERVKHIEEVIEELSRKEKEARVDVPPWPTAQSDQERYADEAARRKVGKEPQPGKEFLDEFSKELQPDQARRAQKTLRQPDG